jgi:hypothetical protein
VAFDIISILQLALANMLGGNVGTGFNGLMNLASLLGHTYL